MIDELLAGGRVEGKTEAQARVRAYVGRSCASILDNTAVFKQDEPGRRGFDAFMAALGLENA